MKYLLDTNICSYIIRKRPPSVIKRFLEMQVGEIGLSTITLSELNYGVEKSSRPEVNRQALKLFTQPLVILPFDEAATTAYGFIRAYLERLGMVIGPLDMLIAAHAMSVGAILVTHNVSEFNRVPDLIVEDWV